MSKLSDQASEGKALPFSFLNQTLWLHPTGALYWEEARTLMVADVHVGKVTHFRKHGIALPQKAAGYDLLRLEAVITFFSPDRLVFLGDLFHSDLNAEWEAFTAFQASRPDTAFVLIRGNHDVLPDHLYAQSGLEVLPHLIEGPFLLTHHPVPSSTPYNMAGHIHPAVHLRGLGRQRLKRPCFLFGQEGAILPAFGHFTGNHVVQPTEADRIFVLAERTVIEV